MKHKDVIVVTPEAYEQMSSDDIAKLLREHRDYWIIRPDDPDNKTEDTYIVKRKLVMSYEL